MTESHTDGGGLSAGAADEISLNMPRKSANDIYFMGAQNTLSKWNQIIFTLSGTTDPRVVPYARACIGMIVDDNIKNAMYSALRDALAYIDSTDLTPQEKGNLVIEACQSAVSEVYSYLDEFVGLVKTNAMAPIATVPDEREVEAARQILEAEGDAEPPSADDVDPDDGIPQETDRIVESNIAGAPDDVNSGSTVE